MRKLFLSIIALTLGIGAWAQETQSVDYIDADGQQKTVTATVVTDETETLSAGWYVVTGEVSRGSITCNGDVHLILADGAKLTATGNDDNKTPGIQVSGDGNSLAVYGQSAQSGQLIATGGKYAAGIGGGYHSSGSNITINGGVVTANGIHGAAGIGGGHNGSASNITINGGTVTANGGLNGAGIGGGEGGSGSNITINGGVVTATCEYYGAGIGGGQKGSGSYITINGGTVTANCGQDGAGIGGGYMSSGSYITINGGVVMANGGQYAAGIGGGDEGSGSNITINGGTVTANGGSWGAGIGGGYMSSGSYITINGGTVTANGGESSGYYGAGIGGGDEGSSSNIKVSADCKVFADGENPPTTEIAHDSDTDLASALSARYAFIEIDQTILSELRAEAIAAIDEAVDGVANDEILAIAREAKNKIMNANGRIVITAIKDAALAELQIPIKWYNTGKTDALGPLGTEHPGPAVKVTKGDTEVILYLPDKVEYIIRK